MTPEQIGLVGCWPVIAVRRQVLDLTQPESAVDDTVGYYVTSLTVDQHDETTLLGIIRGHWSAIENGTHYRRDVTLGEDACTTKHRAAAGVLASLRNLAIGAYELERKRGRTKLDTLNSWCEQQTFTRAWTLLNR